MALVVIGGVAAGLSAAARARRIDPHLEIIVLEKGPAISYGACGLPYFVEGRIHQASDLIVYTPEYFRKERNVDVRTNTEVVDLEADGQLRALVLSSNRSLTRLPADALFICIGGVPRTKGAAHVGVALDAAGYVRTGADFSSPAGAPDGWELSRQPLPLETNLPGLFASGDIRSGSIKRCAAAIGEGSMAVALVHQHLAELGDG